MKKALLILVVGMMVLSTLGSVRVGGADGVVIYHYDCKYLSTSGLLSGAYYVDCPAENLVNPGPYPYQFYLNTHMDVALRIRHILYSRGGAPGENHLSIFVDGISVLEAASPAATSALIWYAQDWYPGGDGESLVVLGNLSAGTHYITMKANESDYYGVNWWEIISPPPSPSSTSIACSPNPASVDWSVSCTATVSGHDPTGTVVFITNSSTGQLNPYICGLSNGTCSTNWYGIIPGTLNITAIYSGDLNNAPSSSSTILTEYAYQYVGRSRFLITPTLLGLKPNDNFTVTVNLTNAQDLTIWQVVLKYSGAGLRLNDVWVPDDNVFAGHAAQFFSTAGQNDLIDGLRSCTITAALLDNSVISNVSNAVLCKANFTVISDGQWLIEVADKSRPLVQDLHYLGYVSYSYWQGSNPYSPENAAGSNCTILTKSSLVGDVNGDFKVDMRDISIVAAAFGTVPGDPRWNPHADVDGDGKVDIRDVALVAKNFGQHFP